MDLFLVPLLLSFLFNLASTFTTDFSRRFGERREQLISAILRNGIGLPLLGVGFVLAARLPAPRLLRASLSIEAAGWLLLLGGILLSLASLVSIHQPGAWVERRFRPPDRSR